MNYIRFSKNDNIYYGRMPFINIQTYLEIYIDDQTKEYLLKILNDRLFTPNDNESKEFGIIITFVSCYLRIWKDLNRSSPLSLVGCSMYNKITKN